MLILNTDRAYDQITMRPFDMTLLCYLSAITQVGFNVSEIAHPLVLSSVGTLYVKVLPDSLTSTALTERITS